MLFSKKTLLGLIVLVSAKGLSATDFLVDQKELDASLIKASEKNDLALIADLLAAGASVSARDSDGRTPLMMAAVKGYLEATVLLLGASQDIKNDVDKADRMGNTPLIFAASNGYAEVVKLLLEAGAHVNMQSRSNTTALMLAAEGGYADVVSKLLYAGARMHTKNLDGETAITLAAENGHDEIVRQLKSSVLYFFR